MSINAAFQFLQYARQDAEVRNQLQELGVEIAVEDIRAIGNARGFFFTAEELQRAHKHDWAMRWIRYGSGRKDACPSISQ